MNQESYSDGAKQSSFDQYNHAETRHLINPSPVQHVSIGESANHIDFPSATLDTNPTLSFSGGPIPGYSVATSPAVVKGKRLKRVL